MPAMKLLLQKEFPHFVNISENKAEEKTVSFFFKYHKEVTKMMDKL